MKSNILEHLLQLSQLTDKKVEKEKASVRSAIALLSIVIDSSIFNAYILPAKLQSLGNNPKDINLTAAPSETIL